MPFQPKSTGLTDTGTTPLRCLKHCGGISLRAGSGRSRVGNYFNPREARDGLGGYKMEWGATTCPDEVRGRAWEGTKPGRGAALIHA